MDSYGLRYDRTFVQVSYVEGKFLKHFSYHLLVHWSPASRPALLSYRKLRFHTIINAPRGSHCGGMVECRLRDPPQAENPVEQDSFLRKLFRKESLVFLAKEQIPVQEADNDDTAEDITDGGRDQIVEDKGSDI